jgi:pimeloyl-ACP methyl ester carboxylesterase
VHLLLLHGALGARTQFDALRPLLDPSWQLLAPDLEGHGARDLAGRPFRIEHFAENVREHLAEHGVARTAIFGYSMGGYVALHLAATHPELVSGVFTLGTKLAWTPEIVEREVRQLDAAAILEKVPRFALTLADRHTGSGWECVLRETAGLLRALGERPPLTPEALRGVVGPVRLALGDRDGTVTLEETRDAMRVLPRGELEVLPGTPHPFEKVPLARLAWSIGEFLARLDAGAEAGRAV